MRNSHHILNDVLLNNTMVILFYIFEITTTLDKAQLYILQ